MKKYKLIKEYPGSPKLDEELEYKNHYGRMGLLWYGALIEPNKYPEFWQEVVEKEYEILSFHIKDNINRIFEKVKDKYAAYKCKTDEGFIAKNSLKLNSGAVNNMFNIYSVKRLSDGEVFTVGDYTNYGKLSEIKLVGLEKALISGVVLHFGEYTIKPCMFGEDCEQWDNVADLCFRKFNNIEENFLIQKAKQKLFTSEDGVDIFHLGQYWENYTGDDKFNSKNYRCYRAMEDGEEDYEITNDNCKRFSTKEAAEEYILMNKPCLSIKDILFTTTLSKDRLNRLKELVKSKL